jgi:hypothetical protein
MPKDKYMEIESKQTEHVTKNIALKHKLNVGVNDIKSINGGGIIMSCSDEREMFKLIDKLNAEAKDFMAERPEKRKPKIAIRGVSEDVNENELINEIISKNHVIENFLKDKSQDDIEKELKIKFKFRRKTKKSDNTWVLEIGPNLWKIINSMNRINIGWKSCSFDEYVYVTRCFKCNGYGHKSDECKQTTDSCGTCGQSHKTSECDRSQSVLFCTNCNKYNQKSKTKKLSTNHSSFSRECETFKRIRNAIKARIDYGQ